MADLDPSVQVSHSQDGRTLTGVGVTAESLREVMDARAPADEVESAPPVTAPAAATTTAPEPPQTRGQKRFSELTQQAKDAQARADAAEKKAADLEARFNQQPARDDRPLGTGASPAPEAGASRQAPAPQYTRPEPTEDEIGAGLKYETYGAFVKDQSQWVWEQQQEAINARVRQGIDGYHQQQAFNAHVESTRAKGRAVYKDFDQMLQNGPGTYVNMPHAAVQQIYALPNTEHVQYAIMKDGALAQRLAALAATNPYAFGLELSKIAPAAPAAQPASTGNTGSFTPPAPLQPVGSGSRTTTPSSADLAKRGGTDFDKSGYREARAAERGRFRRHS